MSKRRKTIWKAGGRGEGGKLMAWTDSGCGRNCV